jgi:signal recognition particle receptor subunit beta
MKIIKGKQQRPQRVVIYGVESVGKTTFASKFPSPLFLDIEGGSNHLNVDRVVVSSWKELGECIQEASRTDYETVVIDSADWAERLAVEDLLATNKKQSVEDFGFGKGWVMAAEKVSRFLTALDTLIDAGKHVVVLAHSKVQRTEPPDILAAYDRYELKLSKQSSPLVKEWADELWFFRFKTKAVSQENGKAKGIGGKERIILTTHSAAYDAKTRSGLAEELPMEWESVAHVFGKPAPKTSEPAVEILGAETMAAIVLLEANEEAVNAFLTGNGSIQEGETWRNASPKLLAQIKTRPQALIAKATAQMEVAA